MDETSDLSPHNQFGNVMRTLIALAAFALAFVAEKITRPPPSNNEGIGSTTDTTRDENIRYDIHDLYMR